MFSTVHTPMMVAGVCEWNSFLFFLGTGEYSDACIVMLVKAHRRRIYSVRYSHELYCAAITWCLRGTSCNGESESYTPQVRYVALQTARF